MTSKDVDGDPVFAALNGLRPVDVGHRRAERLAERCRAVLATGRHTTTAARTGSTRWTRVTGLALIVGWCAVYTIEVARRGAAVWGL